MAKMPATPDLKWLGRLREEVATLPDTLKKFREAVEDLRAVTGRLQAVSEVMERAQSHLEALGVVDNARQLDDAVVAVERQLSTLRNAMPDAGSGFDDAVRQMRKTASAFTELGFRSFGMTPPGSSSKKDDG